MINTEQITAALNNGHQEFTGRFFPIVIFNHSYTTHCCCLLFTIVTGFEKIGLNAANNFFQYLRVKPNGSIFFKKNYGRN